MRITIYMSTFVPSFPIGKAEGFDSKTACFVVKMRLDFCQKILISNIIKNVLRS